MSGKRELWQGLRRPPHGTMRHRKLPEFGLGRGSALIENVQTVLPGKRHLRLLGHRPSLWQGHAQHAPYGTGGRGFCSTHDMVAFYGLTSTAREADARCARDPSVPPAVSQGRWRPAPARRRPGFSRAAIGMRFRSASLHSEHGNRTRTLRSLPRASRSRRPAAPPLPPYKKVA